MPPPVLVFAPIFTVCRLATATLGATLTKDEVEALGSIPAVVETTVGQKVQNQMLLIMSPVIAFTVPPPAILF
ncbi:hypothetical protein Goshw_026722, partial [Gossypium schwendimanii]|nr:hypothetical protein [Gossypium schwendimanii]